MKNIIIFLITLAIFNACYETKKEVVEKKERPAFFKKSVKIIQNGKYKIIECDSIYTTPKYLITVKSNNCYKVYAVSKSTFDAIFIGDEIEGIKKFAIILD